MARLTRRETLEKSGPSKSTLDLSLTGQQARGDVGLADLIVDADVRELPSGHGFNLVA
jgi:hypothetical protein